MTSIANLEFNGATTSKLFGLSKKKFDELVADGQIQSIRKDRYRIGDVVDGWKAFLHEERERTQKTKAASRVQEARASRIEIRTLRDAGKFVEIIDSHGFIQDTIGTLRTALFGAAAASTRNLSTRAVVGDKVEAAVTRLRTRLDAESQKNKSAAKGPIDYKKGIS